MSAKRFEVVRLNWHRSPEGWMRMVGERAVASFSTRAEAEAEAARREELARAAVNPFACGFVWTDRTTMPEGVFYDWVGDHDLPLPKRTKGQRNWVAWWKSVRKRGPKFEAMVWGVLSELRFFTVREVTDAPKVYLLLQNTTLPIEAWEPVPGVEGAMQNRWTGQSQVLPEGGTPVMLSFDRTRLEQERDRLESERLAEVNDPPLTYRNDRDADPFGPEPKTFGPGDASFLYEIVELPLPEAAAKKRPTRVRVVFHIGHFISNGEWTQCEEPLCVIPMRAFVNPAETDMRREWANELVHQVMDPVFFAPGWANGTVGVGPLNKLFESRGLPLLPSECRFGSKTPSTGIDDLAKWWRANGHQLTPDLRPAVWERLGEYGLLCPIMEFTPDEAEFDWV